MICREVETDLYMQILNGKLLQQVQVQACTPLWDNKLELHTEARRISNDTIRTMCRVIAPWLSWDADKPLSEADGIEMQKKWEKTFGSLSDPEIQEKLKNYKLPPINKQVRWIN